MAKDPSIILSKQDIEKLISAHDGDMALVYLYARCRGVSGEDAARDLCMTAAAVDAAEEKLLRLGLSLEGSAAPAAEAPDTPAVSTKGRVILAPAEERPSYSSDDIADRAKVDEAFQSVIYEAQQLMGRNLSSNDMKILFGMYDYLGLPAEVIMVLMNYSVQLYEEQKGEGRRPTLRYVEKEAYRWVADGITSLDEADRYITSRKDMDARLLQAADALDIRGRVLTDTETRYLSSWIEMGFGPEMLHEAFDRTMTNTGKRAWKYMNTILEAWKDKGIFTLKDVKEKDSSSPKKKPAARREEPASAQELNDNLDNLFRKLKNKRGEDT